MGKGEMKEAAALCPNPLSEISCSRLLPRPLSVSLALSSEMIL